MRVRIVMRLSLLLFISLSTPVRASWFSDRVGVNVDLNKEIGTGIASMGAPVADKFEESGNRLIDKMSGEIDKKITQVDALATKHETIFFQKLSASLENVDAVVKDNIQLADEDVAKRLGNADVIATKAEVGFEAVIRHVLLFGAILVFVVTLVLRWLNHVHFTRFRLLDAALALVSLAVVYGIYIVVPHGNLNDVVADHENGYNQAMGALDFREALYHLAQLKILRPGHGDVLGREKKVVLLQDVLTRPYVYHTQKGVRTLLTELSQASFLLPKDPDIKVIDAFVTWQLGPSRIDEYAAAATCAKAILDNRTEKAGQFFLRPLAVQYIRNYMLNPLPVEELAIAKDDLKKTMPALEIPSTSAKEFSDALAISKDVQTDPLNPLLDIVNFDRLTADLYNKTIPAYVGMIYVDSQAAIETNPNAKDALVKQRDRLAKSIGDAWQIYDDQISKLGPEAIIASRRVATWAVEKAGIIRTTGQYSIAMHNTKMTAAVDSVLPAQLSDGNENFARTLLNTEITSLNKNASDSSTVFETQLVDFVQKQKSGSPGEKIDAGSKVELSAAQMGLFVCGEQFACEAGNSGRDYSQVIQAQLKDTVGVSNTFYRDTSAAYQVRTLALW